jgi:hypothetical protein
MTEFIRSHEHLLHSLKSEADFGAGYGLVFVVEDDAFNRHQFRRPSILCRRLGGRDDQEAQQD